MTPGCIKVFNELRKRKLRYIIYKIDAAKGEVDVLESVGSGTYDEFVAKLPEDDGRYAVYDYDYKSADGCAISKIVFITWVPDGAKVRVKMLYASSKDKFKQELGEGIQYMVQACDLDEVDESAIKAKCT